MPNPFSHVRQDDPCAPFQEPHWLPDEDDLTYPITLESTDELTDAEFTNLTALALKLVEAEVDFPLWRERSGIATTWATTEDAPFGEVYDLTHGAWL